MQKIKWYVVIFFAFWPALLVNPFGTVMSDIVLQTTVNIVDKRQLELTPDAGFDLMLLNGKYYSGFSPGASVLALPFYIVLKPAIAVLPDEWAILSGVKGQALNGRDHVRSKEVYFLQLFLVWCFVAPLFGWTAFRFMEWMTRQTQGNFEFAFVSAITFAFGGILLYYAASYSRQLLSALLLLLSFLYFLELKENLKNNKGGKNESHWNWIYALILGFVVTIEHQTIFAVLALAAFGFLQLQSKQSRVRFVLAFLLPLFLNLIFYYFLIGAWFETPYDHRALFAPEHRGMVKGYGERFATDVMTSIEDFEWPTFEKLYELTFGSFKGLFYFSLPLALGLMAYVTWFKTKKLELATVFTVFISGYVINMMIVGKVYWSGGGFFWGPRYLLWAGAFMIFGWQFYEKHKFMRYLFYFSAAISTIVNFCGAMFFHRSRVRESYEIPHDLLFPLPKTFQLVAQNWIEIPILYHQKVSPFWHLTVFGVGAVLSFFILYKIWRIRTAEKNDKVFS